MAAAAFWRTRFGVSERYLSGTGFTAFGIVNLLIIFAGRDWLGDCSQKNEVRAVSNPALPMSRNIRRRRGDESHSSVDNRNLPASASRRGFNLLVSDSRKEASSI